MEQVTLREATRLLNRNYTTAFYHLQQGRIPARRVGGVWLVQIDEVRKALDSWQSPKARNTAVK